MAQIEMTIDSVRRNSMTDEEAIILKEKGAERYLPIYAGSPQASLVAKQLQGVESSVSSFLFLSTEAHPGLGLSHNTGGIFREHLNFLWDVQLAKLTNNRFWCFFTEELLPIYKPLLGKVAKSSI